MGFYLLTFVNGHFRLCIRSALRGLSVSVLRRDFAGGTVCTRVDRSWGRGSYLAAAVRPPSPSSLPAACAPSCPLPRLPWLCPRAFVPPSVRGRVSPSLALATLTWGRGRAGPGTWLVACNRPGLVRVGFMEF